MAFDRDVLPSLDLAADGFEIETEIIVKAIRAGLQIAELPSWEYPRRSGESNLSTFRDGARVLRELVRGRISKTPLHGAPVSRLGDPDRLPEGASAARSIVRKLDVPSAH